MRNNDKITPVTAPKKMQWRALLRLADKLRLQIAIHASSNALSLSA
jgi:hypothetical protein